MSKTGPSPTKAEERRIKEGKGRGTKLRVMRVKRNLSQRELAAASGIPINTIRSFEQKQCGTDCTKTETLCALCKALNCRITDILDDDRLIECFNEVK